MSGFVDSEAVTEYCRLCASRAPADSLASFASTDADSTAILRAIRRLKPSIGRKDGLPQGVCPLCNTLLRATSTFVQKVDHSQELLSKIFLHDTAKPSQDIKIEVNWRSTNPVYLGTPSAPMKQQMKQKFVEDGRVSRCGRRKVPLRAAEITQNRDHSLPLQPMQQALLVDKCFDHLSDSYPNTKDRTPNDTDLPGTSMEMVNKVCKIEVEMEHAISTTQSSEDSEMELHKPFPEFTEFKMEPTDSLAFSNDEMDPPDDDESQTYAINHIKFSDVVLKNENLAVSKCTAAPKDKTLQLSSLTDTTPDTLGGKIKIPSTRNKKIKKTCAPNKRVRKSKSLSSNKIIRAKTVKNKRKIPLTRDKLSCFSDSSTVIEDLPIECEDPNVKRWSEYYICKRCGLNLNSLQNLRQHWWTTHKRCISFTCAMCTINYLNFKKFFRHVRSHQKSLEKCCEYCNKCYVSAAQVKDHKKREHRAEDKPHCCINCGTGFDNAADLQNHRDDFIVLPARKVGDRRFKCEKCGLEFLNKITLVSHMEVHDPTKNNCPVCNKACTSKYTLKAHIFMVHEPKLQFYCQICGKGFKRKTQLRMHIDIHNDVRRFSCGTCSKRFRTRGQMKSHQLSHSSEKLYECDVCNKSYKFKNCLKTHLKTHGEDYVPYSCDVCVKTFTNWSNFNKHMKRIHGKDMAKRNNIFKLSSQFSV